MSIKVKKHTRKGRTVKAHTKGRGRNLKSSFMDRVSEGEDGNMVITILGREYPYPLLPKDRVGGLVRAKSAGKYYNKNIRGRYF